MRLVQLKEGHILSDKLVELLVISNSEHSDGWNVLLVIQLVFNESFERAPGVLVAITVLRRSPATRLLALDFDLVRQVVPTFVETLVHRAPSRRGSTPSLIDRKLMVLDLIVVAHDLKVNLPVEVRVLLFLLFINVDLLFDVLFQLLHDVLLEV